MKFRIGDYVRIKSYEEIKKTLDDAGYLKGDGIAFPNLMKEHCGKTFVVSALNEDERPFAFNWNWAHEWLESVNTISVTIDPCNANLAHIILNEAIENFVEKHTKKLNVTVQCMATYNSSIDVPGHMTLEEAIEYANMHINEIPLTKMNYVNGSDSLDEENCSFMDE